ncbi:MAG: hypothetical protein GF411_14105 [Candidatus Lokiarchaeota archaeon]|nr:hypothetical protein [Candidatus Lokiarchaeota archaeon]
MAALIRWDNKRYAAMQKENNSHKIEQDDNHINGEITPVCKWEEDDDLE